MKIGILTYFGAHNYGAFLQAYALREIINNNINFDVELINYRSLKEINAYSVRKLPIFKIKNFFENLRLFNYNQSQFYAFEKNILKYQIISKEKLISDSIDEFTNFIGNRYDMIIAGSDEIWKVDGFRSFPNAYWLPNISCKKMAYAVSSRNNINNLTDEQISLIRDYIKGFDYIGTRDHATLNLITELSIDKEKCHLNCDPTFLYDFPINKDNGIRILHDKFKVKSPKKIIGLILSNAQYGKKIANLLNDEFEVVSLSSYIKGAKNYAGLSPFDWIDIISSCDMIISSRFHGVVFSIKTNRPFLALEMDGYSQETSKIFDLLERNNLSHLYIKNDENISNILTQYIPNFLAYAENVNYNVNYKQLINAENHLGESFINKLRECTL